MTDWQHGGDPGRQGPPGTGTNPGQGQQYSATYQQPSYQQPSYEQQPYQQPSYHEQHPQYPTSQYPPVPNPPSQYPQSPYPTSQYPPSQNPYGYPMAPTGPRRPGLATAAAVLGYVNAGLLILAAALLLLGASIVHDIQNASGSGTDYGLELGFDGFLNLVAAGLLIAGAVMFTGGKSTGRIVLSVGNGIVVAEAIYWMVRFNGSGVPTSGFVIYAILFGALAVLPLAFSFVGDVNRWLSATAGQPRR